MRDLAGMCRDVSAEELVLEVAAAKLKPVMWISRKWEPQPGSVHPCRAAVAPQSKTRVSSCAGGSSSLSWAQHRVPRKGIPTSTETEKVLFSKA